VGRRSKFLQSAIRAVWVAILLVWSAIAAHAECCCGGPDTLFEWDSCKASAEKASGDSGGGDSGGDSGSKLSDPIQSDRPGFGDSPTTVGCGVCQLELGYQYTYDRDSTASHINHSYPQSLLRLGTLANWFEVRVSWSMEQETDHNFGLPIAPPPGDGPVGLPPPRRQTFVGSDDMNVGFKIELTPQDGCRPQMGVVADMFVPTGSSAFTAGEVLPEIEWIYTWALTKKLSVTGVTFLTDTVDDETNHTYLEFSEGIEADLALSDKVGSYLDWHVSAPAGADTNLPQEVLEGGFTLLLNNNLVLDAEAGLGLNDATPDYFVGGGVSFRR
jgi:Putative MetA-pathway of phenol degradation